MAIRQAKRNRNIITSEQKFPPAISEQKDTAVDPIVQRQRSVIQFQKQGR